MAQEDLAQAPHDILASYCVGNYLDPEDDVLQVIFKVPKITKYTITKQNLLLGVQWFQKLPVLIIYNSKMNYYLSILKLTPIKKM